MTELTKIHDDLYYDERSAGGIVYKLDGDKVFWLVVKTSTNNRYNKRNNGKYVYKFPKGHLKKDEVLKVAAQREVEEEGQVKTKIITKLGSNDYVIWDKEQKKKIIKKVTFFLMEYMGESNLKYFDNEVVLERKWMNFNEAMTSLAYDSEKILLKKAKMRLEEIIKK